MRKLSVLSLMILLICQCANPGMPTGGPPDKEAPIVLSTHPENKTLQFNGTEIRFDFNEYVQQNSFKQAFRLEPNVDVSYSLKFKKKSVIVQFDKKLPENTTIIATIGVLLSDFKSNKIKAPITLAISTGEEINSAKVKIRVLNATDGKRAENIKLFLIPSDKAITDKALYTAETDSAGMVSFGYLPESTYRILLVEDVNRNRTWDSFEWAQPVGAEFVDTFKDSTVQLSPIYFLKPDTVKPSLEGIGLFAQNRLRLRFSEPVYIQNDSNFIAVSELDSVKFRVAYSDDDNPTVYWAISRTGLKQGENYSFPLMPFMDQFRNKLDKNDVMVTGEDIQDTTQLRILSVKPKEQITNSDTVIVTYSTFIDKVITDSLLVIEQETQMKPYPFVLADDHLLKIFPEKKWDDALSYQFRLFNPINSQYVTHNPKVLKEDELGEISIITNNPDSTAKVIIEVSGKQFYTRIITSDSVLVIPKINEKEVLVRAFIDYNQNDKWDSGTISPYLKPEPFYINPKVVIKQKMTTEMSLEF